MTEITQDRVNSSKISLVEELPPTLDPFVAFQKLAHLPYPVFLDSSLQHPTLGKVSYVTADPFHIELDSTRRVDEILKQFRTQTIADLPPFQGGLINLCAYDSGPFGDESTLINTQELINEFDNLKTFCGFYETILIFDHQTQRNWILSHGFPETEPIQRAQLARKRINQFSDLLDTSSTDQNSVRFDPSESLSESKIAKQRPTDISERIFSNFTRNEYINAVQKCIDYIYAGDIFQVNLSQRLLARQTASALSIYEGLRRHNQATFSACLDLGAQQVLSSSPERLISISADGQVETRPIKGTRQRSCYPEANLFAAEGLVTSEKDRAENVMIVDLLRNDLSKICQNDSIHVAKLCGIEQYEFVQHLVSVIRGQLKGPVDFREIFAAIFPGGSITGAPKHRAMQIIAEIEQVSRGPYCGSLGFFSFDGAVDQNILIRTITASKGWLQIPVGGGVVSQSDPVSEYEETVVKAHGMLRSII